MRQNHKDTLAGQPRWRHPLHTRLYRHRFQQSLPSYVSVVMDIGLHPTIVTTVGIR
jgi:hypothetical protein